MSDGQYPPISENSDDLPRTLRRARDQKLREQAVADRAAWDRGQPPAAQPSIYGKPEVADPYASAAYDAAFPVNGSHAETATVTRFQVPFFSLMGFFLKAVFAAIPAILIFIVMLYGLGVALKTYFPQLIQMEIVIRVPKV